MIGRNEVAGALDIPRILGVGKPRAMVVGTQILREIENWPPMEAGDTLNRRPMPTLWGLPVIETRTYPYVLFAVAEIDLAAVLTHLKTKGETHDEI